MPSNQKLFNSIGTSYCSSGHTISSAVEEGVSGTAKNKCVCGVVKSGVKLGWGTQQL